MSLKKLQMPLGDHRAVLATRRAGVEVGREIQDSWSGPSVVDLDFSMVEAVTPPFLDEIFKAVRLAVDSNEGSVVYATGMNEDVCETAKMVLERDRSALVYVSDGEVGLITDDPLLAETFSKAAGLELPFTAPQLAEDMNLTLQNANQRLNALRRAGAAAREKDPTVERGRRFLYLVASSRLISQAQ